MEKRIPQNLFSNARVLFLTLALASGAAAADKATPTYRIITGENFLVCRAYLQNLKAFGPNERDPVCAPRAHPTNKDFTEPEWEMMDIWQNLELIYKAEMSYGIYRNYPERHPPYEEWRKDFEAKVRSGEIHPSLKLARIEFVKGKSVPVVAYARNHVACEADFARDGGSENTGHRWFFYDEASQTLKAVDGFAGTAFAGAILLFRKGAVIVNTDSAAEQIRVWQNTEKFPIFAPIERCRYDVDDPAKPASMRKQRPITK